MKFGIAPITLSPFHPLIDRWVNNHSKPMWRYIFRRLLQAIPILLGISILSFILVSLAPGDPVLLRTAGNKNITAETRDMMRKQLGLDQPLPVQYIRWFAGITDPPGRCCHTV